MNDKFYKDFYHAAEQCLDKEKFEWILKFMEMKKLKDKMVFPELYKALEEQTMNRLDSIKKDAANKIYEIDNDSGFYEGHQKDIEYLLQRLERYETALKEILNIDSDARVIHTHDIAEKALKDETHT